jgi:hypothetical protein
MLFKAAIYFAGLTLHKVYCGYKLGRFSHRWCGVQITAAQTVRPLRSVAQLPIKTKLGGQSKRHHVFSFIHLSYRIGKQSIILRWLN